MLHCLHRWFAYPDRHGRYILVEMARVGIGPLFYLAAVVFTKRVFVGKFKAGGKDLS